jgi:hypothetical protein
MPAETPLRVIARTRLISTFGRAGLRAQRLAAAAAVKPAICGVLTLVILADATRYWIAVALKPGLLARYASVDYDLYMTVTRAWLAGQPFYHAYQLAGPYTITAGAVLYPPSALYLFVPFTLVPAVLWWAIPLGVTACAVWRLRPVLAAWPLIAFCAWWPTSGLKILTGNPDMWVMAAVALGCLYGWPFVVGLLKPSLFPFALLGVGWRSWWIALAALVLLSLPFGGLWLDWLHALLNSRAGGLGGGLLYSTQEVPLVCLPLAAWLGSLRGPIGTRCGRLRVQRSATAVVGDVNGR